VKPGGWIMEWQGINFSVFWGCASPKLEPSVKSIHRRITALLQEAGWPVGKDRVQRIWDREGLKVIRCNQKFLSFGEPSELNEEE
jgi:hypothetical protein